MQFNKYIHTVVEVRLLFTDICYFCRSHTYYSNVGAAGLRHTIKAETSNHVASMSRQMPSFLSGFPGHSALLTSLFLLTNGVEAPEKSPKWWMIPPTSRTMLTDMVHVPPSQQVMVPVHAAYAREAGGILQTHAAWQVDMGIETSKDRRGGSAVRTVFGTKVLLRGSARKIPGIIRLLIVIPV